MSEKMVKNFWFFLGFLIFHECWWFFCCWNSCTNKNYLRFFMIFCRSLLQELKVGPCSWQYLLVYIKVHKWFDVFKKKVWKNLKIRECCSQASSCRGLQPLAKGFFLPFKLNMWLRIECLPLPFLDTIN